jgi:hypothetical protein
MLGHLKEKVNNWVKNGLGMVHESKCFNAYYTFLDVHYFSQVCA